MEAGSDSKDVRAVCGPNYFVTECNLLCFVCMSAFYLSLFSRFCNGHPGKVVERVKRGAFMASNFKCGFRKRKSKSQLSSGLIVSTSPRLFFHGCEPGKKWPNGYCYCPKNETRQFSLPISRLSSRGST